MAPSSRLQMDSAGDSSAEPERRGSGTALGDLAELEATYQDSTIRAGQEVEDFASALDKYTISRAPVAERRARVFKLIDHYHDYTRQRAKALRDRQPGGGGSGRGRGWQLVQAGSNSSGQESNDMDVEDGDDEGALAVSAEEIEKVEEEAQTWDLVRRILPLRYRDSPSMLRRPSAEDTLQSRKQYWDDFILSDSTARERKIVLEWLQTSAGHGPPIDEVVSELQQNADRGDILVHGWLHTSHKIKLQKSVNGYQGVLNPDDPDLAESHLSSNTLITQLDPDAMTRQGRKLEPQDESFERAIWLGCYELLRRGRSTQEIRDWCAERTESWRAATLSRLPLSNPDDDDVEPFDPLSLILWRRTCFAAAREGGTSDFERAVYGILSGDLPSVEKVSQSWDDFLFAHYNALLRTQFDSYLIRCVGPEAGSVTQSFPTLTTLQQHCDPVTAGRRLLTTLETDERTKDEALTATKALQGAILANDLDRFLYLQGLVLCKQANRNQKSKLIPDYGIPAPENPGKFIDLSDHDGLRVLAHILIIISTLDRLSGFSKDGDSPGGLHVRHRVQEHIVAAYVSFLRLANLEMMVPLYCSTLLGPRTHETLTRNLIQVEDREARAQQLSIMRRLGINIAEFGKTQPRVCLEDVDDLQVPCEAKGTFAILRDGAPTLKYGRIVKPDFFGEDAEFVDRDDENIIRAIEWLMLIPGLLMETCSFATRAYKYYLKRMRLRAARSLANRVPVKEIVLAKTGVSLGEPSEDDNAAWFEEFESADIPEGLLEECGVGSEELITQVKNLWELECLVRALDSMETLASLAEISREESNPSREMWQRAGREIRVAKSCMKPVLRGWLLTVNEADPAYEELREAYLPETILAYASSLHFVGTTLSRDNLLECMNLAAVIAEKGSDVSAEFIKCGRMKELVHSLASCSKALAISTAEKKSSQASSKKFRETGWSRELWTVRP